jgi:hypothetical protein
MLGMERLKRTVTWTIRLHSSPSSIWLWRGFGGAAALGPSVGPLGWSPKNKNWPTSVRTGANKSQKWPCSARTDSWCPLPFDLAISEAGELRFGQEE